MKMFEKKSEQTLVSEHHFTDPMNHTKISSLGFSKVFRVAVFEKISGGASLKLLSESAHHPACAFHF